MEQERRNDITHFMGLFLDPETTLHMTVVYRERSSAVDEIILIDKLRDLGYHLGKPVELGEKVMLGQNKDIPAYKVILPENMKEMVLFNKETYEQSWDDEGNPIVYDEVILHITVNSPEKEKELEAFKDSAGRVSFKSIRLYKQKPTFPEGKKVVIARIDQYDDF